jgi:hypothetical protein
MSRILFKRAPAGYRNVRGEHVIHLQRGLVEHSPKKPGIDGDFGKQTEDAIKAWQKANNKPETGVVTVDDWTALTGKPVPSLFVRCLSLTSAFEGHGYTFAAGNWDKAYLTWGIVGFTLAGGNLQAVVRAIGWPAIEAAMGAAKAGELKRVIDAPPHEQKAWSERISAGPKKYNVRADWSDAFKALGETAEARQAQHQVAKDVYWKQAIKDLKAYGRQSERDAAIFFDTAVQNGGVGKKESALKKALKALAADAGEPVRLGCVADCIADGSKAEFREDVRSRRRTIATGDGTVHGARYMLECWGVGPGVNITDNDLARM